MVKSNRAQQHLKSSPVPVKRWRRFLVLLFLLPWCLWVTWAHFQRHILHLMYLLALTWHHLSTKQRTYWNYHAPRRLMRCIVFQWRTTNTSPPSHGAQGLLVLLLYNLVISCLIPAELLVLHLQMVVTLLLPDGLRHLISDLSKRHRDAIKIKIMLLMIKTLAFHKVLLLRLVHM
jgi:hypothetical protein